MLRLLTTARAIGLLATSFIATAALADEFSHGSLLVSHPFAFATPPTARAGGGYMTITNTGPTDDRLLAVEAGFPRVMLHRSETTDGVSKMIHLDAVDIPAGETVTFAPGGLHVMFMGLTGHPFQDGRKVSRASRPDHCHRHIGCRQSRCTAKPRMVNEFGIFHRKLLLCPTCHRTRRRFQVR